MGTVSPELLTILCETAKALNLTSLYQLQNGLKVAVSTFAVITIVYMIITKKYLIYSEHHFMVHLNIGSILVFAINNVVTHSFQFTDRLFNPSNPCEWVREAKQCVIFKAIANSSSNSISTTLFFITLDRAIFVVLNPPKRVGQLISAFLKCIQILLSIYFYLHVLLVDFNNSAPVLHCLEDTLNYLPLGAVSAVMQSVLDGCSLCGSLALKYYCERAIRQRNHLTRTFILRQSSMTIKAFLPLIIFHTALYFVWNIAFIYIQPHLPQMDRVTMKAVHGFSNVSPYYTLLAPLLLLDGLRRLKEGRTKEFAHSIQPKLNGQVVPESMIYHISLQEAWK